MMAMDDGDGGGHTVNASSSVVCRYLNTSVSFLFKHKEDAC